MSDNISDTNTRQKRDRDILALSIIAGAAIGAAFGLAVGNIGMGIAVGVAVGVAIGESIRRRQSSLLSKLGIKRNALRKDLFFFFIPFITVFILALTFCRRYGKGLSGLWTILWGVIKQPQLLFVLPRHRAIGLVLFVFGLSTMIIAQATLWRNYSSFVIIKKDHQLITHGIYRFTRNPIYLGAFIVFTGLPVYANSLYGFLTMLLLLPIFLYRIRLEEQLLAEEFQEAFHKYKETTRKLIPFIY